METLVLFCGNKNSEKWFKTFKSLDLGLSYVIPAFRF